MLFALEPAALAHCFCLLVVVGCCIGHQAREGLVQDSVAVYLNRLSDFLFVSARYAAMKTGGSETVYKKARAPKEPKAAAE